MSMKRLIKKVVPLGWRRALHQFDWRKQSIALALSDMDSSITTVFDIGANVGDVSRYMLFRFPNAQVYSFEPCTETFNVLKEGIARTEYRDRSHLYKLGFYDAETEGVLNITSFHGANSMVDITSEYREMNPHIAAVNTEKIPLVRLDEFVREQGITHIDLVKIDVEGVELQVLHGGRETFSHLVDVVVMEISFVRHPRESDEFIKIFQVMHEYGFAPSGIYDVEHAPGDGKWKLAQFDCVFRRFR